MQVTANVRGTFGVTRIECSRRGGGGQPRQPRGPNARAPSGMEDACSELRQVRAFRRVESSGLDAAPGEAGARQRAGRFAARPLGRSGVGRELLVDDLVGTEGLFLGLAVEKGDE